MQWLGNRSRTLKAAAVLGVALVLMAPAVPAPAAPAPGRLFIVWDIVRGSENLTQAQAPLRSCVWQGKFQRNEQVVWRIKVMDPNTGQQLDDKAITRLAVRLGSGEEFNGRFGPHPRGQNQDQFWTASWTIPAAYPSGIVPFTITVAANDGRTAQMVSFNINLSALTVIDGAVPIVPR
jgi:hypothetical protein